MSQEKKRVPTRISNEIHACRGFGRTMTDPLLLPGVRSFCGCDGPRRKPVGRCMCDLPDAVPGVPGTIAGRQEGRRGIFPDKGSIRPFHLLSAGRHVLCHTPVRLHQPRLTHKYFGSAVPLGELPETTVPDSYLPGTRDCRPTD